MGRIYKNTTVNSESRFKYVILVLFVIVFCKSVDSFAQEPEKVYRFCYAQESKEWYEEQARLWKIEIINHPDNTDAWYNYYFANRYATWRMDEKERKDLLQSIENEMGKAIPDSYLYPYIKYYNGERKIEYIEKAYEIKPSCSDLYWEFIQYYELNGMKSQKKEYCEKLYLSKVIISSLYDYNFNMLNSTEKNSILFTNGDNDNYPAWVLQEAKGIREDVTILNAHTVFVLRDYLRVKLNERRIDINLEELSTEDNAIFLKDLITSIKNKYPEIPIHIATTVYDAYKKEINDKLFITGLCYTYSKEQIDNVTIIKKNLEQNLRLDYLDNDWYNEQHISKTMMDRYNLNYLPAFMELAKMYHSSGEIEPAKYWREKAYYLAKQANDEAILEEIEALMN